MKMWLCRSPYGFLELHRKKPIFNKVSEEWSSGTLMTQCIHPEDYPEVTFKNSPQEVELNLKGEDSTALKHYYNSSQGLWCIDKDPNEVTIEWIRENAFRLEKL